MVNLTFLRTFVALCKEKSFTRTAKLLGMTQPGVSQHVTKLEDHFGVVLVNRAESTFTLTEAGRKVVASGKEIVEAARHLDEAVGDDPPESGYCRFSSPGSFGMKMYSFLLELSAAHPGLVVHYLYRPNPTIIHEVLNDEIDVGFVTLDPKHTSLNAEIIDQERLSLIVPRDCADTSFAGLVSLGFVNHPDGCHHAARLLRANYDADFVNMEQFPVRAFNNQITRILEPVALGLGFTALPEYAARAFPEQNKVKILDLKQPVVDPIYWVQKRSRELPSRFHLIRRAFEHRYGVDDLGDVGR